MLCSFIMYRNGRINMYVKFLCKCAAFFALVLAQVLRHMQAELSVIFLLWIL